MPTEVNPAHFIKVQRIEAGYYRVTCGRHDFMVVRDGPKDWAAEAWDDGTFSLEDRLESDRLVDDANCVGRVPTLKQVLADLSNAVQVRAA